MRTFSKPIVVVSKCLEFDACRYNGDVISDPIVKSLMPYVRFIPICPEVEIDLGTPRETIRIVEEKQSGMQRLVQPSTGEDVTDRMQQFAERFLGSLPDVDGFLLKNRSPSCGTRDVKIYAGSNKSPSNGKGSGLFGGKVIERFGHLAVEEEGRLKNFTLREHFFTKLFTITEFKVLKSQPTMKRLVQFHADQKYLFMAYNQTKLKEMGRIVANHEKRPVAEVFAAYEQALYALLKRAARYTSNINVCQHIFGYFKDSLKKEEKEHFLSLLQKYQEKKIPLSSVLTLLRSWAIRFEEQYLLRQTYFEPYPEALVEITDSGKGRDY
ncbi:YbgA family protein [Bacillus sp. OTU530]|uniref:YbgA family protein n=1 Tax=Bacillus sp. OTU530 TaxID=3043862 RepID=UPI00313E5F20